MLIVILTDPFILVMNPTRPRRIDSSKGTVCWIRLGPTLCYLSEQFLLRRCGIWNTLPFHVRNIDVSVSHFKKELFNFYLCLSNTVYDVNTLRPIRLCVSSATLVGHWPACLIECVVDRFIDVCPYTICYCLFLWCFYLYIVIIATITIIIIFSGPHNGACSVCVKARHLGKVVNK